jgi:hypothetical protein
MSGYLLDTNCISELVRIEPDANVMAWMHAANEKLHLSVLTLGEIRKGTTLCQPAGDAPSWSNGWRSSCRPNSRIDSCPSMPKLQRYGA